MVFFSLIFKDSLQAVLFLVPKNVSESHITNDTCQTEYTWSFLYPIQVHQHQARVDALGWGCDTECINCPQEIWNDAGAGWNFFLFHELC